MMMIPFNCSYRNKSNITCESVESAHIYMWDELGEDVQSTTPLDGLGLLPSRGLWKGWRHDVYTLA
jgi:hypothetical protein